MDDGWGPGMRERTDGYLPIEEYGAVGNLRTVALVGRDGSVDWCPLPTLGRPSVFGALLDARIGGRFSVRPARWRASEQRYAGDSWVLETRFRAEGGVLTVTDFMPLRGSILSAGDPDTVPELHRIVRCTAGEVEVRVEWSPRFDYARGRTAIAHMGEHVVAFQGDQRLTLLGAAAACSVRAGPGGPVLRASFSMRGGEERVLVARYGSGPDLPAEHRPVAVAESRAAMRETVHVWEEWVRDNEEVPPEEWAGEWAPLVTRSELVLKLLTHPDTGAIAAAPTTSLPEWIGGGRNWDYRYCWIRDAVFTVQALYALGHRAEAHDFVGFLARAVRLRGDRSWGLQIMYGLNGETELPELELPHLEGYRRSRPVRIGNGAAKQRQDDTYGELLDAAFEIVRREEGMAERTWRFLAHLADRARDAWRHPDQGIWEMRGPPRHFVHSKVMVWTALDRAVRMAEGLGLPGGVDGWRRARERVRALIVRQGYDPAQNAFVQSFGSPALDATGLLIPLHGFLPADDPRVQGTIDRITERLTVDGLVYRYVDDDGLDGPEGAFGLCTFWLADALALSGRLDEAREVFEGIASRANPLGLLSEQIDPASGAFLGNYPQAFTHLGLINSALYLAHAEGRRVPFVPRLHETQAHPGAGRAGR